MVEGFEIDAIHKEVRFRTSRSGGKGGQNVNKVETRVELLFEVGSSMVLSPEQQTRIFEVLRSRINKEGVLQISSSTKRTQLANKKEAIRLFIRLISGALEPEVERKPTKVPKGVREKRLNDKKRTGQKKAGRKKDFDDPA